MGGLGCDCPCSRNDRIVHRRSRWKRALSESFRQSPWHRQIPPRSYANRVEIVAPNASALLISTPKSPDGRGINQLGWCPSFKSRGSRRKRLPAGSY
jgi:hypothetical protein